MPYDIVIRWLTKSVSLYKYFLLLERARAGWRAASSVCGAREAGVLHLLSPGEEQAGAVQTTQEEELHSHHRERKPQVTLRQLPSLVLNINI